MTNHTINTGYMARTALLMAITALLSMTPLGYIYLPFIGLSLTIMVLPVVLGGLMLGMPAGILLGLTFGISSLLKAPTELLGQLLLGYSPFYTVVVCVLPRLLVGVTAGALYHVTKQHPRYRSFLAYGIFGAAGSLVNTLGFVGLLYLGARPLVEGAFGVLVWYTTLTGGLAEAAVNALLCAVIITAVGRIVRPVAS